MGQAEIYQLLRKNPDRTYTTAEMSVKLKTSKEAVNRSLRKLEEQKLIIVTYLGQEPFYRKIVKLNKEKLKNDI